jgi:hypothetical protein
MADPGVSAQNFLRLLLGGAQRGADTLQQRQTMQQQQQPDLMLALQQMMQRKQMADVEQGQRQEQIDLQHSDITARRMEHGAEQYRAGIQQGIENRRADAKLKLLEGGAKSLDEYRKAQAARAAASAEAQAKAALAQQRLSLSGMLKHYTDSPESYEELGEDAFEKIHKTPDSRIGWTMMLGDDGKPFSYRRMKGHVGNKVKAIEKAIESIGGLEGSEDALTAFGAKSLFGVPEQDDSADMWQRFLEEVSQ